MVDKLNEYAKEIGIDALTLEGLIDSHRDLRTQNSQRIQSQNAALEYARNLGYEQGLQLGQDDKLRERLQKMTVVELAEFMTPEQ